MNKYKISCAGLRVLCVVHAQDMSEAFKKARKLFGDIITGGQPWDPNRDSDQNRDWLEIE